MKNLTTKTILKKCFIVILIIMGLYMLIGFTYNGVKSIGYYMDDKKEEKLEKQLREVITNIKIECTQEGNFHSSKRIVACSQVMVVPDSFDLDTRFKASFYLCVRKTQFCKVVLPTLHMKYIKADYTSTKATNKLNKFFKSIPLGKEKTLMLKGWDSWSNKLDKAIAKRAMEINSTKRSPASY
jgi:hypothetical protein